MAVLSALGIGILCAVTSSAPIGPVNMIMIQATMFKGWRSGATVALGGLIADLLFAVMAWMISDALVDGENPAIVKWISIASVPVLIYMGIRTIRHRNEDPAQHKVRAHSSLLKGFVAGVSNPGLLFYWLGAIAVAQSGGALGSRTIDFVFFLIGVSFGISLALGLVIYASRSLAKKLSDRIVSYFTLAIGVGFIVFGIVLGIRALILYL